MTYRGCAFEYDKLSLHGLNHVRYFRFAFLLQGTGVGLVSLF